MILTASGGIDDKVACLGAGADGFFFASQVANETFTRTEYEHLGVPFDLHVLEALRPLTWLLLLHLHGQSPYMDLADRYPVDAVSWEDRETTPSIGEARAQTSRCLVGGVGRRNPLVDGTAEQIGTQVRRTIMEVSDSGLIVAPGCTIPVSVSRENLHALREAVGE
jgi:uroporphyrinogen decarboxylase